MADELTTLLLAARDGDRAALAGFVRRTQADVWRFCAHLVDVGAADDLTQETYLRAHRSLAGYRGEGTARTWLLAIARRTCADALRRRTRRRRLGSPVPLDALEVAEPDPTGHVDALSLLDVLDPDQRTAFVLTQLLGASYHEAATVAGCPVGTIRSRVARARERLVAAASTPAARDA